MAPAFELLNPSPGRTKSEPNARLHNFWAPKCKEEEEISEACSRVGRHVGASEKVELYVFIIQ